MVVELLVSSRFQNAQALADTTFGRATAATQSSPINKKHGPHRTARKPNVTHGPCGDIDQ
jgi:hypothetical protein